MWQHPFALHISRDLVQPTVHCTVQYTIQLAVQYTIQLTVQYTAQPTVLIVTYCILTVIDHNIAFNHM